MKKRKGKKRKLKIKRVIIFFVIILLLVSLIYYISTIKIKNIYVSGNEILTDQEIIDLAKLKDYPNSINNLSPSIKKRLKKNELISDAKIYKKKFFKEVHIEIEENYPLFYYQIEDNYVLYNGKKTKNIYTCPTIVNQIPDTIYDKFLNKIKQVDKNILYRISEIEYKPNEVDDERFFLLMNDGNYVYLTIHKFLSINKYLDIINTFENKKGVLYLDSGEYFDLFD